MQAYISGLSLFAISDHRHGIKGRVEEYKRDMRAVAREFSDRIKVLVGIELATLSYKFDPESYKIADGFDFCLIEHIDEGGSSVGRNLFEFVDKFKIPCGIAHTDLFGYCDMYGLDYNEFFGEMAKRGMFWEMNVNHDSTHSFRHHSYVERFKESEEQRRIVRDAGLYISVGFDSHDSREYAGDRVHDMYDYLKCNGIKTVDELFGGFKR